MTKDEARDLWQFNDGEVELEADEVKHSAALRKVQEFQGRCCFTLDDRCCFTTDGKRCPEHPRGVFHGSK